MGSEPPGCRLRHLERCFLFLVTEYRVPRRYPGKAVEMTLRGHSCFVSLLRGKWHLNYIWIKSLHWYGKEYWPDGAEYNKAEKQITRIPFTAQEWDSARQLRCGYDHTPLAPEGSGYCLPLICVSYYSIFTSCWPVFSSWGPIPTRTTRTELLSTQRLTCY